MRRIRARRKVAILANVSGGKRNGRYSAVDRKSNQVRALLDVNTRLRDEIVKKDEEIEQLRAENTILLRRVSIVDGSPLEAPVEWSRREVDNTRQTTRDTK